MFEVCFETKHIENKNDDEKGIVNISQLFFKLCRNYELSCAAELFCLMKLVYFCQLATDFGFKTTWNDVICAKIVKFHLIFWLKNLWELWDLNGLKNNYFSNFTIDGEEIELKSQNKGFTRKYFIDCWSWSPANTEKY